MLTVTVGATKIFNDETQSFGAQGGVELQLEHSLLSLSKWESHYEKPFLESEKSPEETLAYIQCMILEENTPAKILVKLYSDEEIMQQIDTYINAKQTATWFSEIGAPKTKKEIITSELVYYWMTVYNIPFECERWHLSRLFTLIKICSLKQEKPKKMNRAEQMARYREINAKRKAELGTKG